MLFSARLFPIVLVIFNFTHLKGFDMKRNIGVYLQMSVLTV